MGWGDFQMNRNTKRIQVLLPEKILEEIDRIAEEREMSRSFVMRLAAEEYIKKQKEKGVYREK